MKRGVGAAIAIAATGFIAFVAPADGATTVQAAIVDFAYQHGECGSSSGDGNFTVAVGDTITWVNCGQVAHTVTGSNFGDTNDIPPGAVYSRTFTSPGVFPYYCDNHPNDPNMTGSVTVTGAPAPTTTQTVPPTVPPTTRATTTTTTTPRATTSTTDGVDGVFTTEPTTSTTSTTIDSTVTTRALGEGGDSGTSTGMVALLVLGLGAVGTAAALLLRRIRAGGPVEPS